MGNLSEIDLTDSGMIPPGTYRAVITKCPLTNTKAGTGTYLKMDLQIISGEHKNQHLFHNLTMTNKNPNAVRMGRRDFTQLVQALGMKTDEVDDTSQLLNKPLRIKVRHESNPQYGDSEVVKGFLPDGPEEKTGPISDAEAPW